MEPWSKTIAPNTMKAAASYTNIAKEKKKRKTKIKKGNGPPKQ